MTAVRSPIFAHHEPTIPKEGVRYQYQDQGQQRFRLALVPHRGAWSEAGLTRRAIEHNQPPTVLIESHHDGDLPLVASYGTVEPSSVVVGALKVAEDGGDLVVRVAETEGRAVDAVAELPAWDRRLETRLGPWQIRTFRIPAEGEPVETDLLERPLATLHGEAGTPD